MKYRSLLLFLLVISCTKKNTTSDSLLSYLPQNADVIVKVHNPDRFRSDLKNNNFITRAQQLKLYSSIQEKLRPLNAVSWDKGGILAFYQIGKANYEFLLVVEQGQVMMEGMDNPPVLTETIAYDNASISKFTVENTNYFSAKLGNAFAVSSSQLLLENTIRSGANNSVPAALQKLYDTADPNSSAAVFINLEQKNELLGSALNAATPALDTFADWVALDIKTANDALLLSGVAVANDSTKNFINLFKKTTPVPNTVAGITPQNADAFLAFGLNESEVFGQHQKRYLDVAYSDQEGLNNFDVFGIMYLNDTKAVAVTAFGNEELTNFIADNTERTTNYQGTTISKLSAPDFLVANFSPLTKDFSASFCTVFDNTYVFAEEETTLQMIIANKKSGFTFNQGPTYTTLSPRLANETSVQFMASGKGLQNFVATELSENLANDFKQLKWENDCFSVQLIADGDFLHFNVLLTQIQQAPKSNAVAPIFTLELDSDLATDPTFVTNHRTNRQEIVVQDEDNFLYLISTTGKVLWKKQLQGRVRGDIHQVDLYKNGKLQLAFCTNNQFLVLDRNGEEVAPFNKTFEGGNLNPLAVYDYEKNKDYRFVVTQGRKVFMYNNRAEIVSGFRFTEAEQPIIAAPDHFRMAKKDYLVFRLEDGTLKILHRAGQDRVKVGEKIDFSSNGMFLYKNKFSTTDKKGVLHQVDPKGKVVKTNFNLGTNHGMFATSKTLALMNENVLSIKGKEVELELGVYTAPHIFYIYDKIYVAVTDLQNQKIHLYDSQGVSIPNFPVYGSSVIDLVDMDNDKKLELVAKDQDNSIIVYGIH